MGSLTPKPMTWPASSLSPSITPPPELKEPLWRVWGPFSGHSLDLSGQAQLPPNRVTASGDGVACLQVVLGPCAKAADLLSKATVK